MNETIHLLIESQQRGVRELEVMMRKAVDETEALRKKTLEVNEADELLQKQTYQRIDGISAKLENLKAKQEQYQKQLSETEQRETAYREKAQRLVDEQAAKLDKLNAAETKNQASIEKTTIKLAEYQARLDSVHDKVLKENTKFEGQLISTGNQIAVLAKQLVAASGSLDKFSDEAKISEGILGQMEDQMRKIERLKLFATSKDEIAVYNQQLEKIQANYKEIEAAGRTVNDTVAKQSGFFSDAKNTLLAYFGIFEGIQAISSVGKTVIQQNALDASIRNTSESLAEYAEKMSFVTKLSEKYGVELIQLEKLSLNFFEATKNSKLDLEERQRIFESLIQTGKTLQWSNEQLELSMGAIIQMFSKGKVSAEELRQQLGDHLPGAVNLFAKAMGVGVEELNKMMKDGKVLADDVLPKVATLLEKSFSTGSLEAAKNLTSEWNRLKNMVTLSATEFDKSNNITGKLANVLRFLRENASELWDITKGLTAGYVAYQIASSKLSAAVLLENTVGKVGLVMKGELLLATRALTSSTNVFTASQAEAAAAARLFNASLGPIAIAVAAATAAFFIFRDSQSEAEKGTLGFIKANDEQIKSLQKSSVEMGISVRNVTALAMGTDERKVAIERLMSKFPQYFGGLDAEKVTNEQLWAIYARVNKQIERKIELIAAEKFAEQKADEATQLRIKLLELQEKSNQLQGVNIFNIEELTKRQREYNLEVMRGATNTTFGTVTGSFSMDNSDLSEGIALLNNYNNAIKSATKAAQESSIASEKQYRQALVELRRDFRDGDIKTQDEYNKRLVEIENEYHKVSQEAVKKAGGEKAAASSESAKERLKIEKTTAAEIKDIWEKNHDALLDNLKGVSKAVKENYTEAAKIENEAYEKEAAALKAKKGTTQKDLEVLAENHYKRLEELARVYSNTAVRIAGITAESVAEDMEESATRIAIAEASKIDAANKAANKVKQDWQVAFEALSKSEKIYTKESIEEGVKRAKVVEKSIDDLIEYTEKLKRSATKDVFSSIFNFDIQRFESDFSGLKNVFEAGGLGKALDSIKTGANESKRALQDMGLDSKEAFDFIDDNAKQAMATAQSGTMALIEMAKALVDTLLDAWAQAFDFSENIERAQDIFQQYTNDMVDLNRQSIDRILTDESKSWDERMGMVAKYVEYEKRLLYDNERQQLALNSAKQRVEIADWETEKTTGFIKDVMSGPKGWVNAIQTLATLKNAARAKEAEMLAEQARFENELRVERIRKEMETAEAITKAKNDALEAELEAYKVAEEAKVTKANDIADRQIKIIDLLDTTRNAKLDEWIKRQDAELEAAKLRDLELAQSAEERSKIEDYYAKLSKEAHDKYEDAKLDKTKAATLASEELASQKADREKQLADDIAKKDAEVREQQKKNQLDLMNLQRQLQGEMIQATKNIAVAELQAEIAKLQAKKWFMNAGKIDAAIAGIQNSINMILSNNLGAAGGSSYDPNIGINESYAQTQQQVLAIQKSTGTQTEDDKARANATGGVVSGASQTQNPNNGSGTYWSEASLKQNNYVEGWKYQMKEQGGDNYAPESGQAGADGHERPIFKVANNDDPSNETNVYEVVTYNGNEWYRTIPKFHTGTERVIAPNGDELLSMLKQDEKVFSPEHSQRIGYDMPNEDVVKMFEIGKKLSGMLFEPPRQSISIPSVGDIYDAVMGDRSYTTNNYFNDSNIVQAIGRLERAYIDNASYTPTLSTRNAKRITRQGKNTNIFE